MIKVTVQNNNGSIRLYWRIDADRFSWNPGFAYEPESIRLCQGIAATMTLDLRSGNFDSSLERYKRLANPQHGMGGAIREEMNRDRITPDTLLYPYFERYQNAVNPSPKEVHHKYKPILTLLKKEKLTLSKIENYLKNKSSWSHETFKTRLIYFKAFFRWCLDEKLIDSLPLKRFKIPVSNERKLPRKPFTAEEIKLVLQAFEVDSCCPSASAFKHSHYYPFVRFLLTFGARPAEVIGLTWNKVDLENKQIKINEVLARSNTGEAHASARVRKSTKSGNSRLLPMDDFWYEWFNRNHHKKKPDELVFKSPRGLAINDKDFSTRIWKVVLEKLGIPYRTLYSARHTFGTQAVNQGIPINEVSDLMGHSSVRTTFDNYVHKQQGTRLPTIM
jgi:integrase